MTLLSVASVLFVSSCRDRIVTTENGKTKEGNEYRIFRQGDNSHNITEGDIIDFHVVIKNPKDSVLQDSYKQGQPIANYKFSEKEGPKAILGMFKMLTVGDSAIFRIKTEVEMAENKANIAKMVAKMKEERALLPDSLRKKTEDRFQAQLTQIKKDEDEMPKFYPAGKFITYVVKVMKVVNPQETEKKEKAELEEYIKKNNLKVKTTESGLKYVITKEGTGKTPERGEVVKVNYVGKLFNGRVFDTSIEAEAKKAGLEQPGRKYEPLNIPIGVGQVIPGWDEGIMLLNKGAKATLLIPNKLAYGMNSPSKDIPAGAPLLFEVEVIDIAKPEKQTPPQAPELKKESEGKK